MKVKIFTLVMALFGVIYTSTAQKSIVVNCTITSDEVVATLQNNIFGKSVSVSGQAVFSQNSGYVRILLSDNYGYDLLVYETTPLFATNKIDNFSSMAMETKNISLNLSKLRVEIKDAQLNNLVVDIYEANSPSISLLKGAKPNKIDLINSNLRTQNALWVAGETSVSQMSFEEKKGLFGGKVPDLQGFEYYVGGVFELHSDSITYTQNPTRSSSCVSSFDWRNRHGRNWLTSVKNQYPCGSCAIFAVTGATEALVNLYYNRLLNLDLAEQQVVSCVNGRCTETYPGANDAGWSLSSIVPYYTTIGVVNESCFPYQANSSIPCSNICSNPSERIKIGGKIDFPNSTYPRSEESLKKMIIKYGPLSAGISTWGHAMTLAGFGTIKAGDVLHEGVSGGGDNSGNSPIIIGSNDPRIGQTYWIFKNSYGENWGQQYGFKGFSYVIVDINNLSANAILTPITSLNTNTNIVCEDRDGDGYYYWGIGPKPATCPACSRDEPDGDDSNPNLGAMDEYGYFLPMTQPTNTNPILTVASSQTWNTNRTIPENITIQSGATLTITANVTALCNIITIQNGGKLILSGGTIDGAYIIAENGGEFTIQNNGKVLLEGSNRLDIQLGAVFNLEYGEVSPK